MCGDAIASTTSSAQPGTMLHAAHSVGQWASANVGLIGVHDVDPPTELRLVSHRWHSVSPAPPLKRPAGHSRHVVAASLSWSYCPAAQSTQLALLNAPAAPYVPAEHVPLQLSADTASLKVPGAHGWHGVAALWSWS